MWLCPYGKVLYVNKMQNISAYFILYECMCAYLQQALRKICMYILVKYFLYVKFIKL